MKLSWLLNMQKGTISNLKEPWPQMNKVDPYSTIDHSHKNKRWIYVCCCRNFSSSILFLRLNSGTPPHHFGLDRLLKGSSPRAYPFMLRVNACYFVCLVQFSLSHAVCFNPIEHEIFFCLSKENMFLAIVDP